ncbi:thiol:disulfide interchange protein DsbA [Plasticicumulans lactativorans]|uniref:Thiol:disulfide interchange protein n=1 Tax=Plasticicumulans lactativorans TaxID=1133106 RepID=A0A4R2LDM4_9GAMM|nr:thiol:disulfide interchange protein DsbA/DsbL [Plasticicumulans lactativorans]TCO82629.1 thiol:disulfide interchange protein DsbA [Plasticicumulans lactativorans]
MTTLLRRFLLAMLATLPLLAGAADAPFTAGKHYRVLQTPVATSTPPGQVEVVELFWYGCPHCYALEPVIEGWLANKPAAATFVRIPAPLNPQWEVGTRTYYALEALGLLDKLHRPLFDAIHREHRNLFSEEAVADFVAEQGGDRDAFIRAYRSFDVDAKTRRARQLTGQYRVTGVPSVIVAGKYMTDIGMAGSPQALIELINFLVAQERAPG